MHSCYNTPIA